MRNIPVKFKSVFDRLKYLISNSYINANAIKILDTLVEGDHPETLYFPDLNYSDNCSSLWDVAHHYGRLKNSIIADKGNLLHSDFNFRDRIVKALRYWIKHDFVNPNWWHNQIGVPRNLADIAILMYEYLPDDVYQGLLAIISRGSLLGEHSAKIRSWTGANKIWGVSTTIRHAVLLGDENLLVEAIALAATELEYNFEGIHRDGSFFQHGARLYSGGYGRSFAVDVSQLIYILQGTEWQFSAEKLNIFAVHMLDGLRNMTQFKALDYSCVGREFTRPNDLSSEQIKKTVSLLVDTKGIPRHAEFVEYLDEMNGVKTFEGTKYFNEAALLSHHTDGIYFGAKFITDKLADEELCNDEGILFYNMSYGSHTCVMVDGSEYFNISPVWQYDRIPGTTAANESDEALRAHKWLGYTLPNDVYGGVQGDGCGIIFEKAEHDGIVTIAADFAIPGGMVCLGAGISTEIERNLFTTVEQSHLQGEVIFDGKNVIHHGIRYTSLDEKELNVETREVVGSWKRNSLPESPAPVSGKLFLVSVEHPAESVCFGKKSSYAYMISSASSEIPAVEIIRNDESVQAIRLGDGTVMAVFYEKAILNIDNKTISGNAVEAKIE
ncbi:MAG: hypothetical protein IJE51_05415 [Clostridia bacterium]|nr:hypothetical protein [Clostridia bacterium]